MPTDEFDNTLEPSTTTGDYRRLVRVIEQWRLRSDKSTLSVAQFDIDDFTGANHVHGTQTGDLIADRIRELIEELLQEDGEEVLVVRIGGAKYFALFEGARYSDSCNEVDIVRQAIEITTFELETDELTFTLSSGIIRGKVHEHATDQLVRLDVLAREAKQAKSGGNRTMMEEDSKPVLVDPPKTFVKPRRISIATGVLVSSS